MYKKATLAHKFVAKRFKYFFKMSLQMARTKCDVLQQFSLFTLLSLKIFLHAHSLWKQLQQIVFWGTDRGPETDVSTPIQGSSLVSGGYKTRQANLYAHARVGREKWPCETKGGGGKQGVTNNATVTCGMTTKLGHTYLLHLVDMWIYTVYIYTVNINTSLQVYAISNLAVNLQ